MRISKTLLTTTVLFLALVGRAQVVLPPSSDNPYSYFRDCVAQNGEENESTCEQHTQALFLEKEEEPELADESQDYAAAQEAEVY